MGGFLLAPPLRRSTILMSSDTMQTDEVRSTRKRRSVGRSTLTVSFSG